MDFPGETFDSVKVVWGFPPSCTSFSFSFFIQVLVNISLVFGSEMYVRLPLISYGGISIAILMIAFGLILATKK